MVAKMIRTWLFCAVVVVFTHHVCSDSTDGSIPTYRVTTIVHEPYMSSNLKSTDPSNQYVGLIKDILDRIGEIIHVNFQVVHVADGKFGHTIPGSPGNWTGMIGELLRKEADVAAAALTVSAERAKSIHFSQPFADLGLRILVKKSPNQGETYESALLTFWPFSAGVWVSIIVAFFLVTLVLYIIGRLNPEELAADRGEDHIGVTTAFYMTFSMLALQGSRLTPTSVANRTLVCFWSLFAVLTLIYFTASLTSMLFLRVPYVKEPLPFYTFEQMSRQSKVQYGTMRGGSTMRYFQNAQGKTEQRIGEYISAHPELLVSSTSDGVERVRKGDGLYALMMESDSAYYMAAQEPCDLTVTGEELTDRSYSFACRPETSLCREIDVAIVEMKWSGELRKITDKWMSGTCGSYQELSSPARFIPPAVHVDDYFRVKYMDIHRFTVPLALLSCGIILSVIISVVEIMLARRKGVMRGKRVPIPDEKQGFSDSPDIDM